MTLPIKFPLSVLNSKQRTAAVFITMVMVFTTLSALPAAAQTAIEGNLKGTSDEAVNIDATSTECNNTTTHRTIAKTLGCFLDSGIGKIIRSVAQVFGVCIILGTLIIQIYKALQGGLGVSRVLPTIAGAMLIGAFMFDLTLTVSLIGAGMSLMTSIFGSVSSLVPGIG